MESLKVAEKIEWNIEPIKSNDHDTGEVQIWAEVPEATAAYIVKCVNAHETFLALVRRGAKAKSTFPKFAEECEEALAQVDGKGE